ncbi:hypothetical protein, partial [Streptococcus hyointestinalis]|uniref:hypothetical protein n=1 Tax=Streptococcus hyointestinalis TaxID=1337 RepID=UPI003F9AFE4A
NDGLVAFHYKSYGTFFIQIKSPITSEVALPTTDIIEPGFLVSLPLFFLWIAQSRLFLYNTLEREIDNS